MTQCIYCNKNTTNINHSCRTMRAQQLLEPFEDLLIKWLKHEKRTIYSIQKDSPNWANQLISGDWLRDWCRIRGIETHSIKSAANLKSTRQKYKESVKKIYNVDNVSKSDIIKQKKKQTCLERYGVDNQFKRKEIKDEIPNILLKKYGVNNARYITRSYDSHYLSTPHKKISEWLFLNNIKHANDVPNLFPKPKASNNRIYSPIVDIWIEQYKTVIEIYGTYWHADPRRYHPTDIMYLHIGPTTAKQIWEMDSARKNHIESFGVKMIEIWEADIKESFDNVTQIIYDAIRKR